MSISYLIGYFLGYPLLKKYGPKIHFTKEKFEYTQIWFRRFGKFALTIGYFIPGIRHLTAYSAGISKWSYQTFNIFAILGAIIWVMVVITLGTYLGEHWLVVIDIIHRHITILVWIMIVITAIVWYFRKSKSKENNS